MNQPGRPGLFLFTGIRRLPTKSGIVAVRDICEVRTVRWRREERLAVFFIGRNTPFDLSLFDGDFKPLRLDFGGERCS